MEKIEFNDPDTGEKLSLFVVEKALLSGEEYLLVTEDEDSEEAEAYVLKKTGESEDGEESYEFVEDDGALDVLAPLFAALMEDTDVFK